MTIQIGTDPKTQLRQALNDPHKDVEGGWVLVSLPGDGPISVQAYDDMNLGEVLAALTLGQTIMSHDILFGDDDDDDTPPAS